MNNLNRCNKIALKSIELFVFDMAGTTVDENNLVYKAVRQAINEQGFNVSLEDCLEYGAGKEKYQAIYDILRAKTVVKDTQNTAEQVFMRFQVLIKEAYNKGTIKPFTNILLFFALLRKNGKKVALNTGYSRETAEKILSLLDWQIGRDIDALITADDVKNGRPNPDMIELAMVICGVDDKKAVLKAGDSVIDIEEGKNAACGITVGVLSGAQTREQLGKAQPTLIVDYLTDLDTYLQEVVSLAE